MLSQRTSSPKKSGADGRVQPVFEATVATPVNLKVELATIADERDGYQKGRRLELMIGGLFGTLPGVTLEDEDVVNAFSSEEIDLIFWNEQHDKGLRFLDCPLI